MDFVGRSGSASDEHVSLYRARLELHRRNRDGGVSSSPTLDRMNEIVRRQLERDVAAIEEYRRSAKNSVLREPYATWLENDRDFVFSANGLGFLRNRYLHADEPIQHCMLRLAKIFARGPERRDRDDDRDDDDDDDEDYDETTLSIWRLFYDAISTGMLSISSIMASADDDSLQRSRHGLPGEACRLMVAHDSYGIETLEQLNEIAALLSNGVGVGFGVASVPRHGYRIPNKIRTGFLSLLRQMNASNTVTMYERLPKFAAYLYTYNDTVLEALVFKEPTREPMKNVYIGLMAHDYFFECVREKATWHLFSGQETDDRGKKLCDYVGDEYREAHRRWVSEGRATKSLPATQLMDAILVAVVKSGSPYVVNIDVVNRYHNQRHLGPVKTLNLCAEIANHATADKPSSCTLMSCNLGLWRETEDSFRRVEAEMRRLWRVNLDEHCVGVPSPFRRFARYAFALGYLATRALNRLLNRRLRKGYDDRREIGISPMGVFDAALVSLDGDLENETSIAERLVETCRLGAEMLYKGGILASCDEYRETGVLCRNWSGSEFSKGRPQWALRAEDDSLAEWGPVTDWRELMHRMTRGMSNSMITAQAPTATTAQLTEVTESICMPISAVVTKESSNGRTSSISYGFLQKCMFARRFAPDLKLLRDTDLARRLYECSAPYVDQSQSVMISLELDKQRIFDHLTRSWANGKGLKTSLYYALPRQHQRSLALARRKFTSYNNREPSTATIEEAETNENNPHRRRVSLGKRACPSVDRGRFECEGCSL